jgi:hypothetical protein
MTTKTLAAAALGLVAAGSLALSTSTASAGYKPYHYGLPLVAAATIAAATGAYAYGPRHQVCDPIYKNKKVWTGYGWQWQPVYVGQSCRWVYGY